jgi:hypothetical protein
MGISETLERFRASLGRELGEMASRLEGVGVNSRLEGSISAASDVMLLEFEESDLTEEVSKTSGSWGCAIHCICLSLIALLARESLKV